MVSIDFIPEEYRDKIAVYEGNSSKDDGNRILTKNVKTFRKGVTGLSNLGLD